MPKQTTKHSQKNRVWFEMRRGSYIPVSWQGWFLYVPFILYVILVFLVVFSDSQPLVTHLVILVPYLVSGLVVMTWIARQRSR